MKTQDKVLMSANSRLNSIQTVISQALIDMDINHGGFLTILKEKYQYEKMRKYLRSEN